MSEEAKKKVVDELTDYLSRVESIAPRAYESTEFDTLCMEVVNYIDNPSVKRFASKLPAEVITNERFTNIIHSWKGRDSSALNSLITILRRIFLKDWKPPTPVPMPIQTKKRPRSEQIDGNVSASEWLMKFSEKCVGVNVEAIHFTIREDMMTEEPDTAQRLFYECEDKFESLHERGEVATFKSALQKFPNVQTQVMAMLGFIRGFIVMFDTRSHKPDEVAGYLGLLATLVRFKGASKKDAEMLLTRFFVHAQYDEDNLSVFLSFLRVLLQNLQDDIELDNVEKILKFIASVITSEISLPAKCRTTANRCNPELITIIRESLSKVQEVTNEDDQVLSLLETIIEREDPFDASLNLIQSNTFSVSDAKTKLTKLMEVWSHDWTQSHGANCTNVTLDNTAIVNHMLQTLLSKLPELPITQLEKHINVTNTILSLIMENNGNQGLTLIRDTDLTAAIVDGLSQKSSTIGATADYLRAVMELELYLCSPEQLTTQVATFLVEAGRGQASAQLTRGLLDYAKKWWNFGKSQAAPFGADKATMYIVTCTVEIVLRVIKDHSEDTAMMSSVAKWIVEDSRSSDRSYVEAFLQNLVELAIKPLWLIDDAIHALLVQLGKYDESSGGRGVGLLLDSLCVVQREMVKDPAHIATGLTLFNCIVGLCVAPIVTHTEISRDIVTLTFLNSVVQLLSVKHIESHKATVQSIVLSSLTIASTLAVKMLPVSVDVLKGLNTYCLSLLSTADSHDKTVYSLIPTIKAVKLFIRMLQVMKVNASKEPKDAAYLSEIKAIELQYMMKQFESLSDSEKYDILITGKLSLPQM